MLCPQHGGTKAPPYGYREVTASTMNIIKFTQNHSINNPNSYKNQRSTP